jgi:hypothetical protein
MTATPADDTKAPFWIDPELIRWAHHAHLKNPTMTSYGFPCSQVLNEFKPGGNPRFSRLNNWAVSFTERDAWMVAVSGQFLEATGWNPSANSKNPGSYYLKHVVERWAKSYIYEGAPLLAAVEIGVPLKRYGSDRWGAFVGVSANGLRSLAVER